MKALLLSSLVKVFPDCAPNTGEFLSLSVLRKEGFSFQIALMTELSSEEDVSVYLESPFRVSAFLVKSIPAGRTCYDDSDEYFLNKKRKAYPDLLVPLEDEKLTSLRDTWTSLWFKIDAESVAQAGKTEIKITLTAGKQTLVKTLAVEVIAADLPEQTLLHTNWFHNDCLCTWYKVEPFSEKYWDIVENYIRIAVLLGVSLLLTPIFTPGVDPEIGGERPTVQLIDVTVTGKDEYAFGFDNFKRYITVCLRCGVKAFEISHLFSQWGAQFAPKVVADVGGEKKRIFGWETKAASKSYVTFLRALAPQLNAVIDELGIKERCWFHVSDEPSVHQIPSYRRAAKLVKELFPDVHTFDALSDFEFYKKGLIKTPVPANNHAMPFVGKTERFWTYYCCGQHKENVSNRFFAMPSLRNRILGFQLFTYDAQGFLQWGHNFWYSQYSRSEIDPFKVADAGGAFPAGDAFVVYPDKNGAPMNSLRFEVFYDGLCDMRALQLLETLSSRHYALEVMNSGLDAPISLTEYPHNAAWFLHKRDEINNAIKQIVER